MNGPLIDAIVIGGGPAGLSAAMAAGRACRSVVVIDDAQPAHFAAAAVHNVIGFDGVAPRELRSRAWEQLAAYDVKLQIGQVVTAERHADRFVVVLADGTVVHARSVVLAGGHRYEMPPVPGLQELFGTRAFHCPFCHGWEVRGQRLAYFGAPETEAFTDMLRLWSDDVSFVALTDASLPELAVTPELGALRIDVPGGSIEVDAIFAHPNLAATDDLPEQLGIERVERPLADPPSRVAAAVNGATSVPGVFVAGDLAAFPPSVAGAMASGTMAGGGVAHFLSGMGVTGPKVA